MDTTIKIESFSEFAKCPKCGTADAGANIDPRQIPAGMMVGMGGPMPGMSVMSIRYCPGGQEPEATEPPLDPALAMVEVIGKLTGKDIGDSGKRRINICAGILTEHLHKICRNCHYEYLTETKDRQATAAWLD